MLITNSFFYTKTRNNQHNQMNFTSNPNSKRLKFMCEDFFINIDGYGKDYNWANQVMQITNETSKSIKSLSKLDEILPVLSKKMQTANKHSSDKFKANHTGILRTFRKGYEIGIWCGKDIDTPFGPLEKNPYTIYTDRFKKTAMYPLKKPYDDISLTTIEYLHTYKKGKMRHGSPSGINPALNIISDKYSNLHSTYIQHPENVTEKTLGDINENIAEIRWLMAHATPWERGSDGIANTFMRALYKAMGIKTYQSKEGLSFDLEAYCTNLADYKKNFHTYFKRPPEVIN